MTRPLPDAAPAADAAPANGPKSQASLQSQPSVGTPREEQAAQRLQAAYRGHMERRSSQGLSLHKDHGKVWHALRMLHAHASTKRGPRGGRAS